MVQKDVKSKLDFAIHPLVVMIEPMGIPWFRTGSAGEFVTHAFNLLYAEEVL